MKIPDKQYRHESLRQFLSRSFHRLFSDQLLLNRAQLKERLHLVEQTTRISFHQLLSLLSSSIILGSSRINLSSIKHTLTSTGRSLAERTRSSHPSLSHTPRGTSSQKLLNHKRCKVNCVQCRTSSRKRCIHLLNFSTKKDLSLL